MTEQDWSETDWITLLNLKPRQRAKRAVHQWVKKHCGPNASPECALDALDALTAGLLARKAGVGRTTARRALRDVRGLWGETQAK